MPNTQVDSRQEVFIGVGSNIDPERNILGALHLLRERVELGAASMFYHTAPLGGLKQPEYLNGVLAARVDCTPRILKFEVLRPVEEAFGRTRTADPYASRTIDFDILVFGTITIREPDLRIPDPDIAARPFLAAGLFELAPDLRLPDTGERVRDLMGPEVELLRPALEFSRKVKEVLCT